MVLARLEIRDMGLAEIDKKDLVRVFDNLCERFKLDQTNGSIELHFSQGTLAKIHERRVY